MLAFVVEPIVGAMIGDATHRDSTPIASRLNHRLKELRLAEQL